MESKIKKQHNKSNNKDYTKISKTMCYLLRHQALEHGLKIEADGFVNLDELLRCQPMKKLNVTKDTIFEIVKADSKGRYELVEKKDFYIRAVQGHSINKISDDQLLTTITNIFEYPIVVHGTYFEPWNLIKQTGLNKMTRNHVHFSIGYKADEHVKSGMRQDCQVYVEINAIQSFYNGIKFLKSKNNVILSSGIDGVIHPKFFKKVIDHNKKILYAQIYELVIFIDFKKLNANESLGNFTIINNQDKKIIHTESFENLEQFNYISEFFIQKELITKPFIILINKEIEDNYVNFIQSRQDDIKYISFYSEYIPIANQVSKLVDEPQFTSESSIRIDIDYKKHYENLKSKETEANNGTTVPTANKRVVVDYKLTRKQLADRTQSKNFVLMFLNYEENAEDLLKSFDYILLKDYGSSIKSFNFKFETTTIENNLKKFLEELKHNLSTEGVLDKMLFLCITDADKEELDKIFKRKLINKPKFMDRNIIVLNPEDFSNLQSEDYKECAEVFMIQYIQNEQTTEKVKIKI